AARRFGMLFVEDLFHLRAQVAAKVERKKAQQEPIDLGAFGLVLNFHCFLPPLAGLGAMHEIGARIGAPRRLNTATPFAASATDCVTWPVRRLFRGARLPRRRV